MTRMIRFRKICRCLSSFGSRFIDVFFGGFWQFRENLMIIFGNLVWI